MSIDKFGHYSSDLVGGTKIQRGPPGEGFKLTEDGNFNINNKRLCNVGDPKSDEEAVNVKYMKQNTITLSNDYFDVEMKNVSNVADPKNAFDAVNKAFLENTTKSYVDSKLPDSITQPGCCDFKQNKLINVADPNGSTDAINKQTLLMNLDNIKNECKQYVDDKIFYIKEDDSLDFKQNRLTNVGAPKDDTDAINRYILDKVMIMYRINVQQYTDDSITKLVNALYKLYKETTKDNPIISRDEFSRIYTV